MDRSKFYASLRARDSGVFGTSLSQSQVENIEIILDEAQARGVPLRHLAYALATARHEVGSAMKPTSENLNYSAKRIREVWPTRFASVDAAKPYANNPQRLANKVYAGRMGNGPEASGDGWRYRGRGYPQTTGEENYGKVSKFMGVDLVKDPDRAMEPRIAVVIMIEGMTRGTFTGKKFADYLNGEVTDYRSARAIINDDVNTNGAKVAGYAVEIEKALRAGGYIGQAPKTLPGAQTAPAKRVEPAPASQQPPASRNAPATAPVGLVAAIITALALVGAWLVEMPCQLIGVLCQ